MSRCPLCAARPVSLTCADCTRRETLLGCDHHAEESRMVESRHDGATVCQACEAVRNTRVAEGRPYQRCSRCDGYGQQGGCRTCGKERGMWERCSFEGCEYCDPEQARLAEERYLD